LSSEKEIKSVRNSINRLYRASEKKSGRQSRIFQIPIFATIETEKSETTTTVTHNPLTPTTTTTQPQQQDSEARKKKFLSNFLIHILSTHTIKMSPMKQQPA